MKTPSYHEDLIEDLKNPKFALGYLNACLEDYDEGVFLLALKHVAEAHGGLGALARKTKLNREHLFRMLSKTGNPRLENLRQVVAAFGWEIRFVEKKSPKFRRAA